MKKKNLIFSLLLIMIISYITPVNACPFTFNDYKKTGEEHSFVVGDYVFDLTEGLSPSLEDFAIAARTIPEEMDEYVYEITYVPGLGMYNQMEIFSNKTSNKSSDWPKFFDTTYNYRTSININAPDYDIFTCKTNNIKVNYSLLNTKGEGDYKIEANRIIDIQSTDDLGSAKYCVTTDNECIPDTNISVSGTASTAMVNYETNILPQHVCTEAYDIAGNTSGVVCDNVMVKVDANPIKIEPTNEYKSIVEGSPHTVQGLFDIEFSVSSGNIYYFYYDNDDKYILSNLADLPSGKIKVEAIGKSGSGLISEKVRVIIVRKNEVTYDFKTNGGISASKTKDSVEFEGRANLKVTAEKPGYEFVGWNTDKNADYALESLEVDGDITLYAIFKKEVEVHFDIYNKQGNLPAVPEYDIASCVIYNNETDCEIIVPGIQSRVGYEALGWSTEKDKTPEYFGGEAIRVTGDERFYSVTKYIVPNTATIITLKDGEIDKEIKDCYLYNGDKTCEVDISNVNSDDYEGLEIVGFVPSVEDPIPAPEKGPKIELDGGKKYYAYYEDTYSVNFVSDDSHVETITAVVAFIVTESEIVTKTEEITVPSPASKNNYEVIGWRDDLKIEDANTHAGDKMHVTKNATYNAIYATKITINYESTSDTTNIPAAQEARLYYNAGAKKSSSAVVTIDSGLSISRPGHIFNGWISGGKNYGQGTSISLDRNMTFTAEWTDNATLVVFDYKTNGGSSVTLGSTTYTHGISAPIDVTKVEAYKSGYDFVGWSTQANAQTSTMTKFEPQSGTSRVTLYAIFRRNITINYANINQSILTIDRASSENYMIYNNSNGQEIILPNVTSNNPNIEFLGWSTKPKSTEVEYKGGEKVIVKENTTFYTIIRNNVEFVSTYVYYNGNTRLTKDVACKLFNDDVTCKTEFNPGNIKYNNAIISGWSSDPNSIVLAEEQAISGPTTFYAVYSKQAVVKYYSGLNTDKNAPSTTTNIVGVNYLTTTNNNIKAISKNITLENPDGIAGFITLGWSLDKEASSAEYYNNSILPITDNTNFYAVYSKKISLSYTTLGGSPIPATETETIYYNTGVKNPTNEARFTAGAAPTKEGVELEAWLLNNDESKSYKPGDIVAITENSKLYAKYKNRKYTITLNGTANGGLNPTKNIISCGYDEKFELNNYSASTNKSGYTFVGWSLEPNSKEIIKEYRVPAENTTLYAVFKKTLKANWLMYDTKAGMSNKPYTTCDIYNNEKTCYTQVGSMTMNPNYTAVGWSKTRGSTQVNAGIGLTTPITQDTDFYSITKITQDLVGTFYYYSNTNVSNVSTSCGLYNGATSCSISSPSNPSNYLSTAFNAWSNRNDGYTAASLNISANTNYYAYYRQITELNYNSGLFSNNVAATKSTETYTVEYIANTSGGWNSVPNATLKNPTSINDFNALGWREDTSMTIQEYDVNSQISMIKSYDLYAVYNRTLTLSYDLQGGTPARNNQTATQYYNSGAGKTTHSFTLAAAVSKTGYTFKNWKVDSLSGTAYNAGAQINIIEDSKMYANLEVNSYDVTINAESNGSVSSSSIKVNYGGTNTFTVTPNTGYYLESLSCTNGYTASGYTTGTSATGSQTVTISNNNNANDSSCSVSFKASCPYSIGHSWRFYYTEGVQEFKAECAGTYKLEVWGAQGGDDVGTGGLGGHAIGSIDLIKNQQLYIVVGGRGKTTTMTGYINSPTITAGKGGYNGGGDGNGSHHQDNYSYEYHYMLGAGGGGATHIATTNRGILENYDSYRSEVLLVAGGGGGALYDYEPRENNGDDKIITQDGGAGGSGGGFTFGKGMSGSSGGGGGWSGGTSGHVDSSTNTTSTGGTNYIGNVTDSDSEYGIRYGDGYARIYLVSLTN